MAMAAAAADATPRITAVRRTHLAGGSSASKTLQRKKRRKQRGSGSRTVFRQKGTGAVDRQAFSPSFYVTKLSKIARINNYLKKWKHPWEIV